MGFLKKAVRSTGFDIKRFRPGREEFLANRRIDTILDVGANVGQFGCEVRAAGFTGRIVSFEPVKHAYDRLVQQIAGDRNWTAYNVGLSNRTGSALINISRNSVFNSLQPTTHVAVMFDKNAETLSHEHVALHRLEEFDDKIAGERLFLKIDTQGHERNVLAGVGRVLDRICGIQLELPISMLYADTWSMAEALQFMRELGFLPTYFYPVNFHCQYDPIAIVEVDCIFRRFDPRID